MKLLTFFLLLAQLALARPIHHRLTEYDQETYKYAPIAGGLDLYIKGFIVGISENVTNPNVCILQYDHIYTFSLLFNEMLDFYSSAEATSFTVFDKIVEAYSVANLADLNCHLKQYEQALLSKFNDSFYIKEMLITNISSNALFLY